jgi:hypothetical protein
MRFKEPAIRIAICLLMIIAALNGLSVISINQNSAVNSPSTAPRFTLPGGTVEWHDFWFYVGQWLDNYIQWSIGQIREQIGIYTNNIPRWLFIKPAYASSTFGITTTGSTSYPRSKTVTNNNSATIDTSQSKFGGASGKFVASSSQYLSLADSADWYFGTGSFTVDFQIRFNTLPSASSGSPFVRQYVDDTHRWYLYVYNTAGTYSLNFYTNNAGTYFNFGRDSSPALTTGIWYHIALVRSGNSWYWFQSGSQLGTTGSYTNTIPDFAAALQIAYDVNNGYLDGWLDELRISKGIAYWTSNFNVPSSPYARNSYTVLLLHNDPVSGSTTTFLDDSITGQILWTKATGVAGYIQSFNFYSTSSAGNFQVNLYSDSSGPSTLLIYCPDTAVSESGWQAVYILLSCTPTSYSATAVTYWIGFQWTFNSSSAYSAGPSYTAGSSNTGGYSYQAYGTPPSTTSGVTLSTENWSEYVALVSFYTTESLGLTISATAGFKTASRTIGETRTEQVTPIVTAGFKTASRTVGQTRNLEQPVEQTGPFQFLMSDSCLHPGMTKPDGSSAEYYCNPITGDPSEWGHDAFLYGKHTFISSAINGKTLTAHWLGYSAISGGGMSNDIEARIETPGGSLLQTLFKITNYGGNFYGTQSYVTESGVVNIDVDANPIVVLDFYGQYTQYSTVTGLVIQIDYITIASNGTTYWDNEFTDQLILTSDSSAGYIGYNPSIASIARTVGLTRQPSQTITIIADTISVSVYHNPGGGGGVDVPWLGLILLGSAFVFTVIIVVWRRRGR